MQIDIDFEVFKALTAMRESETDSYNAVIRRLLRLPNHNALSGLAAKASIDQNEPTLDAFASVNLDRKKQDSSGLLGRYLQGAWFNNAHFPEGTKFRATYKGKTYYAHIQGGRWLGEDKLVRTSPSDAASAISGTNVNGWKFWYAQLPGDPIWRRLDEFRQ